MTTAYNKKHTKETADNFNRADWEFERSSGYAGYRNINPESKQYNEWIAEDELCSIVLVKKYYLEMYKTLTDFKSECLKSCYVEDSSIYSFLDKMFYKNK